MNSNKINKKLFKLQYIIDEAGKKSSVILPCNEFDALLKKIASLEQQAKKESVSLPVKNNQPAKSSVETESIANDFLKHLLAELKQYKSATKESERKHLILTLIKELKNKLHLEDEEKEEINILHHVPILNAYFLKDISFANQIESAILLSATGDQRPPIVFHANSGIGKSTQLIAILQSKKIQKTFSDGIFWFRLGIYADILAHQIEIIQALGGKTNDIFDVETATKQLLEVAKNKRCLIVLDDVCDPQDVLAFRVLGKHYQILVSTAEDNVVEVLQYFIQNIHNHPIKPLSQAQATEFFLHKLNLPDVTRNSLPIDLDELIEVCQYSPSALHFIANIAQTNLSSLEEVLERLLHPDYDLLKKYPPTLIQSLHISVESLGEEGDYYLALAVFGSYTRIPRFVVFLFWHYLYHLKENQAIAFANQLIDKGLLVEEKENGNHYFSLHTFQYEYIAKESDLEILHNHLLAAYRLKCGQHGWMSGPNDGYFFENLCLHLHNAERDHELRSLLLDFDWIHNKLKSTNIYALFNDYEWLEANEIELVKKALYDSALSLMINEEGLAEQLLNHLWEKRENKDIQALLNQAHAVSPDWQWQEDFPDIEAVKQGVR